MRRSDWQALTERHGDFIRELEAAGILLNYRQGMSGFGKVFVKVPGTRIPSCFYETPEVTAFFLGVTAARIAFPGKAAK
jgi:hypothetical protein